jgi:hypothetical protein
MLGLQTTITPQVRGVASASRNAISEKCGATGKFCRPHVPARRHNPAAMDTIHMLPKTLTGLCRADAPALSEVALLAPMLRALAAVSEDDEAASEAGCAALVGAVQAAGAVTVPDAAGHAVRALVGHALDLDHAAALQGVWRAGSAHVLAAWPGFARDAPGLALRKSRGAARTYHCFAALQALLPPGAFAWNELVHQSMRAVNCRTALTTVLAAAPASLNLQEALTTALRGCRGAWGGGWGAAHQAVKLLMQDARCASPVAVLLPQGGLSATVGMLSTMLQAPPGVRFRDEDVCALSIRVANECVQRYDAGGADVVARYWRARGRHDLLQVFARRSVQAVDTEAQAHAAEPFLAHTAVVAADVDAWLTAANPYGIRESVVSKVHEVRRRSSMLRWAWIGAVAQEGHRRRAAESAQAKRMAAANARKRARVVVV